MRTYTYNSGLGPFGPNLYLIGLIDVMSEISDLADFVIYSDSILYYACRSNTMRYFLPWENFDFTMASCSEVNMMGSNQCI
jgi:hypothetical protein